MRYLSILLLLLFFKLGVAQQTLVDSKSNATIPYYKTLMLDNTVNFYTVVEAAEQYFSTIDKSKKGSGWKKYQRWKSLNEYKYYPSGNRADVAPGFAWQQFQLFLKNTPQHQKSLLKDWQNWGPSSIDSITNHYSAGLGRIEDFYVNPSNPNLIYLGSKSGGFWKTANGGISWTGGITDTLIASGVNSIAVSPTNPDSIIINIQNSQNEYSHGLFRSTNGGDNWEMSNFNPTTLGFGGFGSTFRILDVKYHPRVKDLVFIGTTEGIYRSADNLQTWTKWAKTTGNTYASEITFHPTVDSIIYFAEEYPFGTFSDNVFRSLDTGKTFQRLNTIDNSTNLRVVRLSVSDDCPDCLYYASSNGVWKSTDRGNTFQFLSNPDEECRAFAVSNVDTANMIYGFIDLEVSNNGGKSFNQITNWHLASTNYTSKNFNESFTKSTNYVHADARNMKFIAGKFYVATDGFLCSSDDNGRNWEILSNGTQIRENYKLSVSQGNNARIISGSQDNGTSFRTEKGWVEIYGADGMSSIIHPLNDKYLIYSFQFGNRIRSLNGGLDYNIATPSGANSGDWIAPILHDPLDHFTIYDFRKAVYKSSDFASSSAKVGEPSTFIQAIKVAAIAENNSDIIVVGYNEHIELSMDGGKSFSDISNGLPYPMIQDIAFDPNNDSVIAVVYGNHVVDDRKVYLSYDLGKTWENISYNLQSIPIRSVVIDHTDSSTIYVGGEIGVYTKSLNAKAWELYNKNLPNVAVRDLEIMYGSNALRAATWGRGLWESSLKHREEFPAIVSTAISSPVTSLSPKASISQYVSSKVSYSDNLNKVYVKWGINSINLDSTIDMLNTEDSTWQSVKALPSGEAGDKVYFKVFAVGNNNDTSETYRFMYKVNAGGYCDAKGNSNQYELYIKEVKLDEWTNTSLNSEYISYDNLTREIYIDTSYQLSIEANENWESNQFGAWIDFNKDELFDKNERILYKVNGGAGYSNEFTVPKHAKVGDTVRLRIRLTRFREALPCGDAPGEVEDYKLVIKKDPNLSFSVNNDTLCFGEKLIFTYNGDSMDSLKWLISNGERNYTSESLLDSIKMNQAGDYLIELQGFKNGQAINSNESEFIHVVDTFSYLITETATSLSIPQLGANYQWISCSNGSKLIPNADAATFVPAINGKYAVMVSVAQCTVTSECISFVSKQAFRVYPNPTTDKLWIETNLSFTEIPIQLFDLNGNLVLSQNITSNRQFIALGELPTGLYIVRYLDKNRKFVKL